MHQVRLFMAALALLSTSACDRPAPAEVQVSAAPRFVASAACGACHEVAYEEWRGSHHQLAMQVASNATVLGDFSGIAFDYFYTQTRFLRRGNDFVVSTEGADGASEDFEIAYTFGVDPLQQYLVELPGGRLQALPFAWDTRPAESGGQRWFHLHPDEFIEPGDELHWTGRNYNWNYMCAECHSTDVSLNYDAESQTFHTTYAEISVGCESCHGPGSRHIKQARAGNFDDRSGLVAELNDQGDATWIMNPETGIAERSEPPHEHAQQPESCGRCHARRSTILSDYVHGRPLEDTHMPALLEESLYFADGQIQDEVYVYGSFLQSKMYRAGVTCTNCHNPHSGKLVTGPNPSDVCVQCHLPAKFATTEHSGHPSGTASCIDCHMPTRTFMQIDVRHDHSFRVPRPDISAVLDTPVVCSNCHESKDAQWAVGVLYGKREAGSTRRPHYALAIAHGRSGFANDEISKTAMNSTFPPISRATALTLLQAPVGRDGIAAIQQGLNDTAPLVRIGALRALRLLPPGARLDNGAELLDDPVRSVRIEAARTLAGLQDLLPIDARRQFTQAADEYRTAFESTANRPESLTALGNFELASGNEKVAARYYNRAIALEPDYSPARLNLADALRQMGNDRRAGEILRAGIERDPDNAALRHAYGLQQVRIGNSDKALEELRRAAELDPENSRYVYVLCVALNSMGKTADALALLEEVRADFPGDYNIGWALATMRRDNGNIEAARKIVTELAKQFPDDRNVRALAESLDVG